VIRYHEVQEYEAYVRSVLSYFRTKEEVIDSLIRDDIYLNYMKEKERNDDRRTRRENEPSILGEVPMSPQYNPDPSTVSAYFYMFSKGDYIFTVGEGKPFEGVNRTGDSNAGIRYPIICTDVLEGDSKGKGKKQMFTCYIHSDGAMQFSTRFIMACLGYESSGEGEAKFNEENQGADYRVDPNPEAPYVGEMWKKLTGSSLVIHASIALDDEQKKQQKWNGFSPLSAV